ncbi:MAG: hypothetical protein RL385_5600 [Pseudomonadota bacterium]|jgi:hypothetical protein
MTTPAQASTSPADAQTNPAASSWPRTLARWSRVCSFAALSLAHAGAARADTPVDGRAVILPIQVDADDLAELADQVAESATDHLRSTLNLAVTPPMLAHEGATGSMRECWTRACAVAFKQKFYADLAAIIRLGHAAAGATKVDVSVVIHENEVYSVSGRIPHGADLGSVLGPLIDEAMRRRSQGPGPWLNVVGNPQGAAISIDGHDVGMLPYRVKEAPGDHYLRVSQRDYAPYTQLVTIPSDPSSEETVEVLLTPLATANLPQARPRRSRKQHAWDWAIGGAGALAGLIFGGIGVYNVISDGDCSATYAGSKVCRQRFKVDGYTVANLVAGSAGFLTTATFWTFAPIGATVARHERETTAALSYRGRF